MLSKHEGFRLASQLVEYAYPQAEVAEPHSLTDQYDRMAEREPASNLLERTRSRARQMLERLADNKIKLVREYMEMWMNESEDDFGIGGVIEIDDVGQLYISNVTFRDDEQEIAVTLAELASNDPPAHVRRCVICTLPFVDPVGKRPRNQCRRSECQREYERNKKADQRSKK